MGLFEILLIAVVTLLVVGPERMPEAVRSVVLTIGRFKRFFSSAREELEKQVGADEIRQQLHNEAVMDSLEKANQDFLDIDDRYSNTVGTTENSILGDVSPPVENTSSSSPKSST